MGQMIDYSAKKRSEVLAQATMGMNLEDILLSGRSQMYKSDILYDCIYVWCPE